MATSDNKLNKCKLLLDINLSLLYTSFIPTTTRENKMYAIYDKENNEYYSTKFESKDDALDGLEELCYQNEWDSQWFVVVRFPRTAA
jgi:hypothetical protein